jgi:hypothetical protein
LTDITRDLAAREEIGVHHVLVGPFKCVDTAAVVVEGIAVRDGTIVADLAASRVGSLVGPEVLVIVIAVGCFQGSIRTLVGADAAFPTDVCRGSVGGLIVGPFDDVDLSIRRPRIRSQGPEGWPVEHVSTNTCHETQIIRTMYRILLQDLLYTACG